MSKNVKVFEIFGRLRSWQTNLLIFIILSCLVFFTQYTLLQFPLGLGLTQDDLELLFDYKTSPDSLSRLETIWAQRGPYTTSPFFYIGILEGFFGLDSIIFQEISIIFKIIATLLIFPLIILLFKSRLLAFLTTLFFAISHSSSGSLQYIVKGTEYLAISLMMIFLVLYYYTFKDRSLNKTRTTVFILLSALMLYLAFIVSPIRIYPLILILPIVEIFYYLNNKTKYNFKNLIIKLAVIYLPIYSISKSGFSPASAFFLESPRILFQEAIQGNWQVFLTPFSGLGYTFLTNEHIELFGKIKLVDSLKNYIHFLLMGPIVIYGFVTFVIAFVLSKNIKIFIFLILLINIITWIAFFYIYNYSKEIINQKGLMFDINIFYTFSMGFYVITVAVSSFIEFIQIKQKSLLYSTVAILFSCIFLWSTWFILGPSLTFHYPIHWYLVIPSMGSSLFIAAILVGIYSKSKNFPIKYFRVVGIAIILIVLLSTYYSSKGEIDKHYQSLLSIGAGSTDQQLMQNRIINVLRDGGNVQASEPVLFYLDTSDDPINSKFYEVTLFLTSSGGNSFNFDRLILLKKDYILSGCIGIILDRNNLMRSIAVKGVTRGFNAEGICIEKGHARLGKIFYDLGNFYAYKLKDKNLIDIKKQVLNELKIETNY